MKQRREILRDGLRWGALLTVGGAASLLGWRSLRGDCAKAHPCGGCPLFSGCDLSKALETKKPSDQPAANHV